MESKKILIWGRYAIAFTVAVLVSVAFFMQVYPVALFEVQIVAAWQSALVSATVSTVVIIFLVFILTLLCGRVYCSTLCPLGIFQEILMFLWQPIYKWKKIKAVKKHSVLGYFMAIILFGCLCGGSVILLRYIDPYAVIGNALSGAIYGICFISTVAILSLFKKRFFCSHICPVGVLLGVISKFSLWRIKIDDKACKLCGRCEQVCPVGCIDLKKQEVDSERCIRCFKCLEHCAFKAVIFERQNKKNNDDENKEMPVDLKRRKMIIGTGVLLLFGVAFRGGKLLVEKTADKIKRVILPAGAGNGKDFYNRCLNCNLCVKNCPMEIIKKATAEVPVVHLKYGKNYCDYDCHKCSEVCPSGAIKKISLKDKRRTKIAEAVIDEDICIKCGMCAVRCPRHIIIKNGGEYPKIAANGCIGCGLCASVCPVKAITIKTIEEQKILEAKE